MVNQLGYKKDFMKIRWWPFSKMLSNPVCIITFGSVFQEDSNYYPQVYLHECLYEYENDSYFIA